MNNGHKHFVLAGRQLYVLAINLMTGKDALQLLQPFNARDWALFFAAGDWHVDKPSLEIQQLVASFPESHHD